MAEPVNIGGQLDSYIGKHRTGKPRAETHPVQMSRTRRPRAGKPGLGKLRVKKAHAR
jgi:hypothetical protein